MDDPLAILQARAAAEKGGSVQEAPVSPPPQLPADKHTLCLQILTDGYVQSFVDFFYLTHKPEAIAEAAEEDDDPSSDRRMLPVEQLEFVRGSLCDAEAARRQNRTKEVYGSYQSLAELFASMEDFKTSVYFREKCLEIAKLVADTEGELRASRELGVAHDKLGNVQESIKFYEKAHALAQGDQAHSEQASRDVVHVSRIHALDPRAHVSPVVAPARARTQLCLYPATPRPRPRRPT
jgi:tetratricopeptide (TPR) repeat protein